MIRIRLSEILKQREMTQKDLAEKAGVSRNAISRLTGNPRQVSLTTIDRVCTALDIDPGAIIVREENNVT
jgi:DNA-binding Xre family transcriptional regulator